MDTSSQSSRPPRLRVRCLCIGTATPIIAALIMAGAADLGVVGCSSAQIVISATDAALPTASDDAAPPGVPDAGTADSGWPGCTAISAIVCDDFDRPDDGDWTRFLVDGGTLAVVQGDASSPPGLLHTVLPVPGDFPSVGTRLARILEPTKTDAVDYSAQIRVVRRPAEGRLFIHEIVASDVKWRLNIELSSTGDRVVEETATDRRSSPLSRQLSDNTWVLLRVRAYLGLPARPSVVSLDGVDVATHVTEPPGKQFVTLYVGQRPASSQAGESIVDVDNVVARRATSSDGLASFGCLLEPSRSEETSDPSGSNSALANQHRELMAVRNLDAEILPEAGQNPVRVRLLGRSADPHARLNLRGGEVRRHEDERLALSSLEAYGLGQHRDVSRDLFIQIHRASSHAIHESRDRFGWKWLVEKARA